jgi:hypothetical protein
MTRNRKIATEVLRREYVFDSSNPPISISDLAAKYGLARSGVAAKATGVHPTWYEQREEFRRQIGSRVIENMADNWAAVQTHRFEMMVEAMTKTLEKYLERLDAGEIKPTTRDAVAVVAALRVLNADQRAEEARESGLIDPQTVEIDPSKLVEMVPMLKRMLASGGREADDGDFIEVNDAGAEPGHAGGYAPTGTEGAG